ncbi:N-acetylglucosaminyldiphosphodolichol N-acetylglucosaminyltransferase catalytic subunit alg13 [Schaereria dolodes]|nr:N-acetylglucosaminyldiphosphodolichol N-acetylglucosaminyltransferase catalytic subunit alg13 [Schaereria dolodes]
MRDDHQKQEKLCFVTIGATASFDSLIKAALSQSFLEALEVANYTDLLLQHGREGQKILNDFYTQAQISDVEKITGVTVNGFDFEKEGLSQVMRKAKGERDAAEGVVISHAGSGTILDALRIAAPLIVVPNPGLLDNHQEELAEELAAQGYVIHGHLNNLAAAIEESETLRTKRRAWPPVNAGHDPSGRGLAAVMDDEMGFVD